MLAMMPPGTPSPVPAPPATPAPDPSPTTDPGRHTTDPEVPAVDPKLTAEVAPAFELAPGQPLPPLVPPEVVVPADGSAKEPAPAEPKPQRAWGWFLAAGLSVVLLVGTAVILFRSRTQGSAPPERHWPVAGKPADKESPLSADSEDLLEPLTPGEKATPPRPGRPAAKKRPPVAHETPAALAPAPAPAAVAAPPAAESNDFSFLPADAPAPKVPLKRTNK
jgi:hypothetical protein